MKRWLMNYLVRKISFIRKIDKNLRFIGLGAPEILKSTLKSFFQGCLESIYVFMGRWSYRNVRYTYDVDMMNALCDDLKQGKHVVLWTAHFHSIEIMLRLLQDAMPVSLGVVYKKSPRMIDWARKRDGLDLIDSGDVRTMMRFLSSKTPKVLVLAMDQFRVKGIHTRFFSQDRQDSPLPWVLKNKFHASLYYCMYTRVHYMRDYHFMFKPCFEDESSSVLGYRSFLSQVIEDHPEQYWWQTRVFSGIEY